MKHESGGDTNYNRGSRNGPQKFGKSTGRAGTVRTCRDHQNYNIKIGPNTVESSGDLLSLRLKRKIIS